MRTDYDVVIIGAGLVGLAFACLLAQGSLQVALVESNSLAPLIVEKDTYHLRVSAINLACEEMFMNLNIWEKILSANRTSPFEKMFVWDSIGRGEIHFDCTEIAKPCLGYIFENATIHNALLEAIKLYPNLTVLSNREPTTLAVSKNHIQLNFMDKEKNSETITAELLVGADGANSWVRQKVNMETYEWPYHHEALVTTVETEFPHQKTAWQCFLSDGPLALLPLFQKNICSIVWSGTPDEIKRLGALNEAAFNFEITNAFENRLGQIKKISSQAVIPLYMRHAKRYVDNRVALIGDAAHTIHPLAGQGINLGFADACLLAKNLIHAKQENKDCGNYISLRRYERIRKSDTWEMIFGMDFFKRLFQSESFFITQMRSLGLNMVDKIPVIKNQFIYRATGN